MKTQATGDTLKRTARRPKQANQLLLGLDYEIIIAEIPHHADVLLEIRSQTGIGQPNLL